MESKQQILFITDQNFLHSTVRGGVQLCTDDYYSLFERLGFNIKSYKVQSTSNIFKRLLIKLKLDTFNHYDFLKLATSITDEINKNKITYIAINQINLAPLARLIKQNTSSNLKIILLSHGNESGDYLPYLRLTNRSILSKWVHSFRLGRLMLEEATLFSYYIDLVLCISEIEMHINKWMGAKKLFFVPRSFNPSFLKWVPLKGRVGFVGTLDHFPNSKGLESLFESLEKLNPSELKIRIVGSGNLIGKQFEEKYSFVEYLGRLDDNELSQEAASWSIFLNPVFWHSRGASTKLAIGINWGLPILSTTQGNRGYQWTKGEIENADTPEIMAKKILEYSFDIDKLNYLAKQSHEIALNGYSLEDIGELLKLEIETL